jgi:peptidoglycan hydrolase-like protein with peptidoglycan-binding domain
LKNALPIGELAIDGDFGDRTEAAVRNLQKLAGMTVDGKAGDSTWRTLPVAL